MPKLNGTGPNGQGPKTGRGQGACANGKRGLAGTGYGCKNGRCFSGDKSELALLEYREKELEKELVLVREEKAALINLEK